MARTKKPVFRSLRIVVLPPISTWPELAELEEKGHTVVRIGPNDAPDFVGADIILGLRCWRMNSELRKYLKLAVDEAHRLRYRMEGVSE